MAFESYDNPVILQDRSKVRPTANVEKKDYIHSPRGER
ncbi:DNA/RNA helicase [Salmonella phage 19]|nr:DNA/RNA helicase [Salmonella phage 19]